MSKSENRKMLSTRISEELIDELTYYRKVNLTGELSQVDYITKAIEEKNERVKHLRAGGRYNKYSRIPIEKNNVDIEKVQQARGILYEGVKEIISLGITDNGISEIFANVMALIYLIDEDINMSELDILKINKRIKEDKNFEMKNYNKISEKVD